MGSRLFWVFNSIELLLLLPQGAQNLHLNQLKHQNFVLVPIQKRLCEMKIPTKVNRVNWINAFFNEFFFLKSQFRNKVRNVVFIFSLSSLID